MPNTGFDKHKSFKNYFLLLSHIEYNMKTFLVNQICPNIKANKYETKFTIQNEGRNIKKNLQPLTLIFPCHQ